MPSNTAGKIDRRALPLPDYAAETYVAPATPVEIAVAEIFAEVLARGRSRPARVSSTPEGTRSPQPVSRRDWDEASVSR